VAIAGDCQQRNETTTRARHPVPESMAARFTTAIAALATALVLVAPAQATRRQLTLFEAPRELLSSDDGLRARTVDEIHAFGVRWLRVILYWKAVAPDPRSAEVPSFERGQAGYRWATYDRVISEARARGMHLLLTISGPVPRWATARRRDCVTRPSAKRFERFVEAVGRRYRGQVGIWSVWNEPNHPGYLRPQFTGGRGHRRAYSPKLYRRLFLAADRGLRASGNGRDRLLMGETAPRGTGRVVAPLRFLRGVLRSRHRLPADGYAHHAYTTRAGPRFHPHNPDDVTIGVLSRLVRALDHEARAHRIRRGMPIYLTEFGIQSRPDPFMGVSFTRQAEYRSISEWYAWRNPRVAAFSQYLMRDDDPGPGSRVARYGGFESGLRTSSGRAKRAYAGFRVPLVADRRGRRVYLWGYVRPAHRRTRVLVEARKRGSRRWQRLKHVTTNRHGYWRSVTRLRRGARYRVVWRVYRGPATRAY
jgi:hypothetical protein